MTNQSDIELLISGNERSTKEDFKGAINEYTKSIDINPDNYISFNNRGIARQSLGDSFLQRKD